MSNDSYKDSHKTSNSTQALKTPGQLLREKRLKLAIDARRATDHLKVTRTKLEAIEVDDYSIFSSSIYIRGHLRNYARLVNVSEAEIMDCYYAYTNSLPKPSSEEKKQTNEKTLPAQSLAKVTYWRWLYSFLAGLILLWVIAYPFIVSDSQQQVFNENPAVFEPPATEIAIVQIIDNAVINDAVSNKIDGDAGSGTMRGSSTTHRENTNSDGLAQENTVGSEIAQSLLATGVTSAFQDTVTVDVDTEEIKISPIGEWVNPPLTDEIDQLVLSFTDDCWLEVTDAEGRILATKLHRAGDRLVLRGSAPFDVMLGNVKAANEVRLNGKAIAITPIGGQRTLRFTVGNT